MNTQLVYIRRTLVPLIFAAALGGIGPSLASGEIININPSKDNTLYEFVVADGDRSNALGIHLFAGMTAEGFIRRGVLAFDIAGSIPPGSTITSVSLSMNMSRTISDARTVELHKLLADWGEGTSNANAMEGQGAPATPNDATWRHRFYDTISWLMLGGDFSGTVSASVLVDDIGQYVWSSAQMVADVQSWLDNPSNNFGWLVLGDESTIPTSKRFDTRESTIPPVLTIVYTESTPTPTPTVTPTATPTPTITPTPTPTPTPIPFSHPLRFPPVATDADVSIGIHETCVQILDGPCTNMWTYRGTYPGLTIRRPTGQTTNVTFTNNLDPAAGALTVHNHGNHSSPENDGQPDDFLIGTGESRTYTYTGLEDGVDERGTMHFYHDHRMDVTGRNVWMGLTGMYIVDDPADPATLPSGAFDLPLAIADRQFDANNQIPYLFNPLGVTGDKFLVNGVYQPYFDVGDRKYRLRILNASNFRTYNLALSTGDSFTQIGTESGLLPAPIVRGVMRMGPAERLDVVVDFAGKLGQDVYLTDTLTAVQLLKFRVTRHLIDHSAIPPTLRALPDIGEPTVTRTWSFDRADGHWTINGLRFDPDRIDAQPVLGITEKWIFTNPTGMSHTVHIHDVDQQCLTRNGGPCYPYETMKETWYLEPGETIEVKLRFTDYTGRYMLHCHMIEHADDGMMAQFEVVAPPPVVQSAFSRKTHGAADTFDIPLPLTGNVGIECRSGGAAMNYQTIINFANSVTVGSASVTSGTGSVSSFSVSGSQVTVNLTGITDVQTMAVTLFDVNDGTRMGDVAVSMGVLVGDVNGDAIVNASDVNLTRSQVGLPVTASNFRADVRTNESIDARDVRLVRSNVGHSLP
jgi:spore coat protein A